jgi:dTDP-glucose 4,6-dehydratase
MPDWGKLRGARIFITGGTGFLGAWMLETFLAANRAHDLGASAVVLTRNPDAFRAREPGLAEDPAIELHAGDVRSFSHPAGPFTHVIHGAAQSGPGHDGSIVDTICRGTMRVLDLARSAGAGKILFISSGAVYGCQPASVPLLGENYSGAPSPLDPRSEYGAAKRTAESLCVASGIEAMIARCFAFLGPRMPLNGSFAAGNFLRDALAGRDIEVQGDGTDVRSYLYAKDCAQWLWTILLHGASGEAYNVGSDQSVTIGELARKIAACAPRPVAVRILGGAAPGVSLRYVPSIRKAQNELGLEIATPLDEALRLTFAWHARGA